ncbi:MAG: prepilin-type N-terminal cleavage/methylation domain-containing protein [Verrucomicrobiia bacterium]
MLPPYRLEKCNFSSPAKAKQIAMEQAGGFSLIEVLTAVGIIVFVVAAVLATLPGLRMTVNSAKALSNVRSIGLANLQFANDHDGRINGVGDWRGPDDDAERGIVFRIAPYLVDRPSDSLSWEEVWQTIRSYNDPNVPDHLTWLPETMRFAWAFNDLFSIEAGQGSLSEAPFRRMVEFPRPSRTLYAMSGIYTFTREMAVDPQYSELPTDTWRIGPYASYRGRIPAVFLDGSATMLEFPFDPDLVESTQ